MVASQIVLKYHNLVDVKVSGDLKVCIYSAAYKVAMVWLEWTNVHTYDVLVRYARFPGKAKLMQFSSMNTRCFYFQVCP